MGEPALSEQSIFLDAIELATPAERRVHVDRVCGGDARLRAEVEALLVAHERLGTIAASPKIVGGIGAGTLPPVSERVGSVVGRYKLLEQIGEGGFGVVYMAEQQQPVQRRVALKVLKPGMDSRPIVARFEAERQALALMNHPNIAQVLDGGATAEGRPFFVMELVRGLPITDYCDQNSLTLRERLELFVQVCQAVQHAHQKGIIHRDIKPSNVLVTLHDGTPVVKVIDFGIAKALGQQLTDKTLFTGYAQMVGTPLYMSPEQAEMSGLDIDTRTDIYSLGVVLYELLTGTTPLDKERLQNAGYDEFRRIIREEEPPKPSTRLSTLGWTATGVSAQRKSDPKRLRQMFQGELDWIVMKALEKDRNRRYETASALLRDIQRHLRDEPVEARPPSLGYTVAKFVGRHKPALALTGLAACILVLLLVVLGGALLNAATREERDLARTNQERAEKAEQRALDAEREIAIRAHLAKAMALRRSGQVGQRVGTLAEIAAAQRLGPSTELSLELRAEAVAAVCLPDFEVATEWDGWPSGTSQMSFDAQLERYAVSDDDGNIVVRKVADLTEIARLPGFGKLAYDGVVLSPDGRFLAQRCGAEGRLKLWRLDGGKSAVIAEDLTGAHFSNVAFRADSRQLACAQPGPAVRIYDTADGHLVKEIPTVGRVQPMAFHPQLHRLAVGTQTLVRILDVDTGKEVVEFANTTRSSNVVWHPNGTIVGVSCSDRNIYLWDTDKVAQVGVLEGHKDYGVEFCFNRAGDRVVSGGWGGVVRLWDVTTGRELLQMAGDKVSHLGFNRDDKLVGAVRRGEKVQLLRVHAGRELRQVRSPNEDNAYGPPHPCLQGRLLAVRAGRGLALLDVLAGKEVALIPSKSAAGLLPLGFDRDGALQTYGEGGWRRWPVRWDDAEPELVHVGPPQVLYDKTPRDFGGQSADGQVVVFPNYELGAVVFQLNPFQRRRLVGRQVDVRYADVSPNGHWAATGSHSETGTEGAKVWDVATAEQVKSLPVSGLCRVGFSSDGRWLATLSLVDHQCSLWSVGSWEAGPKFPAQHSFAFGPDGSWMALDGASPGVVRLLDTVSGQEFARLTAPERTPMCPVLVAPDGGQLIALGQDTEALHIWDLRAIRRQLRELGLDWEPALAPAPTEKTSPLRVHLEQDKEALAVPSSVSIPIAAGKEHDRLGEYDQAVTALSRAINEGNSDPEIWLLRGKAYALLGQWDLADADLDQAIRLQPNPWTYWLFRARLYASLGRYTEAAVFSTRALELNAMATEIWSEHAAILLLAGQREPYHRFRDFALSRIGPRPGPQTAAVVARVCALEADNQGAMPRALQLAGQAAKADPAAAGVLHILGLCEYRGGHHQEATDTLLQALADKPNESANVVSWLVLALVHKHSNNPVEAQQWITKAREWTEPRLGREPGRRGMNTAPVPWPDEFERRLLVRELEGLLKDQPKE